eukprot:765441-Hanusia_phi.AAC.1
MTRTVSATGEETAILLARRPLSRVETVRVGPARARGPRRSRSLGPGSEPNGLAMPGSDMAVVG